jgi:hypothetical protein
MSRMHSTIELSAEDRSSGTEPDRLYHWELPSLPSADRPPDIFLVGLTGFEPAISSTPKRRVGHYPTARNGQARSTCTILLLLPRQAGRYLPLSLVMFGQGPRTRTGPMPVSETGRALSPYVPGMVGAARFELAISKSRTWRVSRYPTPRSLFARAT